MVAVIFEVIIPEEKQGEYLHIAARLKPVLEQVDGFLSIERFQSLSTPHKILSLSFWRDDESVARWRTLDMHRDAQAQGRETVFTDYRLRIATVIRDYGMFDRQQAPADSRAAHG